MNRRVKKGDYSMSSLHDELKADDGCLHITYREEDSQGGDDCVLC